MCAAEWAEQLLNVELSCLPYRVGGLPFAASVCTVQARGLRRLRGLGRGDSDEDELATSH